MEMVKQNHRKTECLLYSKAAVKLMRTRIGLLAKSNSMRSIIDATQREQRHVIRGPWSWALVLFGLGSVTPELHLDAKTVYDQEGLF